MHNTPEIFHGQVHPDNKHNEKHTRRNRYIERGLHYTTGEKNVAPDKMR
jgi:hypothetical protein